VSGAGFIPSNFNTETSDASIREERTDSYYFRNNSLLGQPLTEGFLTLRGSSFNLRSWLTDLVLSFVNRFFAEVNHIYLFRYLHTLS
jgi:hypothetical protein